MQVHVGNQNQFSSLESATPNQYTELAVHMEQETEMLRIY